MLKDKIFWHLTLDPRKEPIVQEDTFAADANPPMDTLPNRQSIDSLASNQLIIPPPAAVKISPAVQGVTLNGSLSRQPSFDPAIVIACINAVIGYDCTNCTVCQH
jgi:hypothetical protein